jgi:protocatechuate 3,4-dioxygenase beta subunit
MAKHLHRRSFIGSLVASVALVATTGCQRVMRWLATRDNSGFEPVSYSFETGDQCAPNATAIDGPFYIPDTPMRRDVAPGQSGTPLHLRFRIVDLEACRPVPNAAVEIWHCNAEGYYSGFTSFPPDEIPTIDPNGRHEPGDSERFCRGTQVADNDGFVEFDTVLPGWYAPRTPHVHVRVSIPQDPAQPSGPARHALTNQVYFPDDLLAEQFSREEPYARRGASPYTNLNDAVIHESEGADGGFLRMTRTGEGFLGTITLAIEA